MLVIGVLRVSDITCNDSMESVAEQRICLGGWCFFMAVVIVLHEAKIDDEGVPEARRLRG